MFYGSEHYDKLLSEIISNYSFEIKEKNPYYFICDSIYAVLAPFCKYISTKIGEKGVIYNISIGNVTRCFVKNTEKYVINAKNRFLKKFSDDNEEVIFSFLSDSERKAKDYLQTKEGYKEFYDDYPMVFKMLAMCADNYINSTYSALENLTLNINEIINKFDLQSAGNIILCDILNSDFHFDFGVFLFDINGKKIVSKQRNISQFEFADDFLKAAGDYTELIPTYLCFDNFGYTSYEEETKPETKDDYIGLLINSGKILGLSFILSSGDMNNENIIYSNGILKIIDYETIVTPYFDEKIADNELQRFLLTGAFNISHGFIYKFIIDSYKTGMFTFEEIFNALCKGFSDFCYDAIKNLSAISNILKCDKYNSLKIRILIRNTIVYDKLGASMYSSPISDEDKYFENISRLKNAFPQEKKALSDAEIYSVKRGCVPIFECEMTSRNLYFNRKSIYENFVLLSPLETVTTNLEHLDDKSIENAKSALRNLIYLILDKYNDKKITLHMISTESKDEENLLKSVYNDIKSSAVFCSDGTVYFLAYQNNEITHIPNELFLGNIGIAYFLFEYLKIYADKNGEKLLYIILDNIADKIRNDTMFDDLSFVSGIGGILYVFNLISLTQNIDKYNDVIFMLTKKLLYTFSDCIDFYGGEAGILYVLSHVKIDAEDFSAYNQIAEKLMMKNMDNDSFAHGNIGIIYSLLFAYKKTQNSKFLNAALEKFKKIDYKKIVEKNEIGLCRGLTGYMLVGIALSQISKINEINVSFEKYFEFINNGIEKSNDSLCCGLSGALFLISRVMGNEANEVFDILKCYKYTDNCHISLGYGKAGIGLALLKFLYPDKTDNFIFDY